MFTLLSFRCTTTIPELPQASAATTEPVLGGGTDEAHVTVTGAGQLMEGLTLSKMVILWVQEATFPHVSLAVQVLNSVKLSLQEPTVLLDPNIAFRVPI